MDLETVKVGDIIEEVNIIDKSIKRLKVTNKTEQDGIIILETVPV